MDITPEETATLYPEPGPSHVPTIGEFLPPIKVKAEEPQIPEEEILSTYGG